MAFAILMYSALFHCVNAKHTDQSQLGIYLRLPIIYCPWNVKIILWSDFLITEYFFVGFPWTWRWGLNQIPHGCIKKYIQLSFRHTQWSFFRPVYGYWPFYFLGISCQYRLHTNSYIIIDKVKCQIFMPLTKRLIWCKAKFIPFNLVRFALPRYYVYKTLLFIILPSMKKLFKAILKCWHSYLKQGMLR